MRYIHGYVVRAMEDGAHHLYGQSDHAGTRVQRFESNGLVPFHAHVDARKARREFSLRDGVCKLRILEIAMRIAETADEALRLQPEKRIVVIQFDPKDLSNVVCFGRRTGRRCTAFDCADRLSDNGLRSFKSYADAIHAREEIQRQSQSPAALATLRLTSV